MQPNYAPPTPQPYAPPVGYAQQAPPQYAPQPQQGYAGPPQQFGQPTPPAPAPQQPHPLQPYADAYDGRYAPAPAPAYAPQQQLAAPTHTPMPAFVDPTSGGKTPSVRHLDGRLVACVATEYDPVAKGFEADKTAEQVTMTVVVLDGGPIHYGDDIKKGTPPTLRVDVTPVEFTGVLSSNTNIVKTMRKHFTLSPGANPQDARSWTPTGAIVLGRIIRSTFGQLPWNLEVLPQGDPGREVAAQFWGRRMAGQWVNPEPIEIGPGQQPQYSAPHQWPAGAQPAPQPQYAGYDPGPAVHTAAAAPGYQQYSPPPAAYAPQPYQQAPAQYAPAAPQYAPQAPSQPQYAPAAPAPAPQQAPSGDPYAVQPPW